MFIDRNRFCRILTRGGGGRVSRRVAGAAEENGEATARSAELFGGRSGGQRALPKGVQPRPDERAGVTGLEWLICFRAADPRRRGRRAGQSFRAPSFRAGLPQRLAGGPEPLGLLGASVLLCSRQKLSCFAFTATDLLGVIKSGRG